MFLNKQKYNESQCQEFIIYNFLKSKIDMDFEGGWYRKFSQKTEKMPLLLYTVLLLLTIMSCVSFFSCYPLVNCLFFPTTKFFIEVCCY